MNIARIILGLVRASMAFLCLGCLMAVSAVGSAATLAADDDPSAASQTVIITDQFAYQEMASGTPQALSDDRWADWPNPADSRTAFTLDYRFRTLASSCTSFEFGTPEPPPDGYSPISRLAFPINSSWHGLEIGYRKPNWAVHCEWLVPQQGIHGDLADFDWRNADQPFTDLGLMKERWNEGQMLDLGGEFKLLDQCFGLPIELWPTAGFRWQRFNITAYDLRQLQWKGVWLDPPDTEAGDIITFNQQYYIGYFGGQLRTTLRSNRLPPLLLKFQGDWGPTAGYNIDHHLIREGDRYTMESTHGDTWHVGLEGEMPLSRRVSLGFLIDHLQTRTTGTHRHYNAPEHIDESWTNGVGASSDQTSYGAFVRVRL